ncbi:hypothetical protein QFC19_004207 [Naganishia cerealis]|uniref:Uncharacterized protein n=1 Tax=Naganishia cerealis TaxID=610337 RepID=A0ACC2VXN8_9TREE|nr:hypothetical protein QFC19_004207 [Naganishia cerealis]
MADDKSVRVATWATMMELYYKKPSGEVTMTDANSGLTVYWFGRLPTNVDHLSDLPAGFRMTAGNPFRTSGGDALDQHITHLCPYISGSPETPAFPDFKKYPQCNTIRMQVYFPSCWDCKNVDSSDHQSHVAYPIDGKCPSTHPCAIPTLFMESYNSFSGTGFPGSGQIMLANGDTTGYGFHGDFVNGFSTASGGTKSLLVRGLEDCADALNSAAGVAAACNLWPKSDQKCSAIGDIVNEDIGQGHYIPKLPGNNPAAAGYVEKATIRSVALSVPSGWQKLGCYADPANSKTLKDTYTRGLTSLTLETCLASCAAKGFKYAGVEWSQECACANSITSGSSLVADGQCPMSCAGLTFGATGAGYCGGSNTMTIYQATGAVSSVAANANAVLSTVSSTLRPTATQTTSSSASPATTTLATDDNDYELVCTRVKKSTLRR